MSNIQVRQNESQLATPAPAHWEPSRLIARMLSWDPFREMAAPFLAEELFAFQPAIDVEETEDGYVFKVDVPGVKESDLDVSISGNRLTICGKREAEKDEKAATYYTYERAYGSFTRSFTLPEGVEESAIRADLGDGVLSVLVPRRSESAPKRIPIVATAEQRKV